MFQNKLNYIAIFDEMMVSKTTFEKLKEIHLNIIIEAMIFLVVNVFFSEKYLIKGVFYFKYFLKKSNFLLNRHNCSQHERVLKFFFFFFHISIFPNLARYSYGWSSFEQHRIIEMKRNNAWR
jgi:hypothetical protein